MNRMATPFWLSHHWPSELHRCVPLLGLHVCARCLTLYPAMLAGIAVQIGIRAPLHWSADPWVAFLLPLPALVDWARGRLNPATGSHLSRMLTGALLGLGLSRTLFLHFVEPGFPLAMAQLGALAAVFATVEAWARLCRKKTDPNGAPDVPPLDREGR
ncbi:MAG: DUF2085 domain-containing protein [Deltaproteobacteria bacterium]|nr:DUF2085 domain-containing protein [Deltaproteobacteria bacterium]